MIKIKLQRLDNYKKRSHYFKIKIQAQIVLTSHKILKQDFHLLLLDLLELVKSKEIQANRCLEQLVQNLEVIINFHHLVEHQPLTSQLL